MPDLPDFDRSFLDVVNDALVSHADRTCTIFKGKEMTYAELDSESARIANALICDGFDPGDRGAVYSTNSSMAFVAALGIMRAGGIWVPINPFNAVASNVELLRRFRCRVVFPGNSFIADVTADVVPHGCGIHPLDTSLDGWIGDASRQAPAVERNGTDTLMLPQTGGTTGEPKGVMLSHRNFVALAWATAQGSTDDRVVLCAAPMTHVGGRFALSSLAAGSTLVVLESTDIAAVLRAIEQHRVTSTFLPPTAIYALLDHPDLCHTDLSSLRSLSYGSAPMSVARLREAFAKLGPIMTGGFGQTECPMSITRFPAVDHFVDGNTDGDLLPDHTLRSVGRPTVLSTVAILDDDGNELPVGTPGEIAVKGPMVCEGYWEDPEETARIRRNGWHLTGDIGMFDEDNRLYVVDRKKDMIITGGFNVYSSEVERALHAIDGVADAAVIGVPHERWGEAVHAFVQQRPSVVLDADELIVLVKSRLGSVKAPKRVQFIRELPRTAIGKIDKKALRALFDRRSTGTSPPDFRHD